jgi:hypothetical protein
MGLPFRKDLKWFYHSLSGALYFLRMAEALIASMVPYISESLMLGCYASIS